MSTLHVRAALLALAAWAGVVVALAADCPRVDASIALAAVASVGAAGWARTQGRRLHA